MCKLDDYKMGKWYLPYRISLKILFECSDSRFFLNFEFRDVNVSQCQWHPSIAFASAINNSLKLNRPKISETCIKGKFDMNFDSEIIFSTNFEVNTLLREFQLSYEIHQKNSQIFFSRSQITLHHFSHILEKN